MEPNPLLSSAVRDCWEHPLSYRELHNSGPDISSPILAFVLKRIRHIILIASEIDEDDVQANAKLTRIDPHVRQYASDKFEIDYKTATIFLRLTVKGLDECMDLFMNRCTKHKGSINAMLKKFLWNESAFGYNGQEEFNNKINYQLCNVADEYLTFFADLHETQRQVFKLF